MEKNIKKAYSLIELSIVITIIAIMVTGILGVEVGNSNIKKAEMTKERMKVIYKALITHVVRNGFLPCPAGITYDKSDVVLGSSVSSCVAGNGIYQSSSSTNLRWGAIPAITLNLPSEYMMDGWGSKFSYIVDKDSTNFHEFSIVAETGEFGYSNSANIVMQEYLGSVREIVTDAVFVIISHGANKFGAVPFNSNLFNPSATDASEISNHLVSSNFDQNFSINSNDPSFDDIVFYKTRSQMVVDYDPLRIFISCPALGSGFQSFTYYNGGTAHGNTACGTTTGTRKAQKCEGIDGTANSWVDVVASCPS